LDRNPELKKFGIFFCHPEFSNQFLSMNNIAINEALLQLSDERKQIDKLILLMNVYQFKRVQKVSKTLKYAFMWLGKAKGALGAQNPYPDSVKYSNDIIEDPQDVNLHAFLPKDVNAKNEIAVTKYFRFEIEKVIKAIDNDTRIFPALREYQNCVVNAWTYACNAKMELGLILDAIRNEPLVPEEPESSLEDLLASMSKGKPSGELDLTPPAVPKTLYPSGEQLASMIPGESTGENLTVVPPATTGDASEKITLQVVEDGVSPQLPAQSPVTDVVEAPPEKEAEKQADVKPTEEDLSVTKQVEEMKNEGAVEGSDSAKSKPKSGRARSAKNDTASPAIGG